MKISFSWLAYLFILLFYPKSSYHDIPIFLRMLEYTSCGAEVRMGERGDFILQFFLLASKRTTAASIKTARAPMIYK